MRPGSGWPLYFAKCDVVGPRLTIRKGEQFPFADKMTLRGLARSLGDPQWDTAPMGDLVCVDILDVVSEDQAKAIRGAGMNFDRAKQVVGGGVGEETPIAAAPLPPRRRGRPRKVVTEAAHAE